LRVELNNFLLDGGPPPPSVALLPDGLAVAMGAFFEIGGVPRDGFAIVGDAAEIFGDGFEPAP